MGADPRTELGEKLPNVGGPSLLVFAGVPWFCCLVAFLVPPASGVWLRVVGVSRVVAVWSLLPCVPALAFLVPFPGRQWPKNRQSFPGIPFDVLGLRFLAAKAKSRQLPGCVRRDESFGWRSPITRGDNSGGRGGRVRVPPSPTIAAGPAEKLRSS